MKKTPLNNVHEQAGGKMVEFAGWRMPIQYAGIMAEHRAVRTYAGIFDLSHMGEFEITGPQAEKFLQYMVTNDVSKLKIGKILYTPVCNERGGVVDDILVYRLSDERYMLVVNAANTQKDYDWFKKHISSYSAALHDKTDFFALIAVQGPASETILQSCAAAKLQAIQYYQFVETKIFEIPVILSRTGYTGDNGFEIYLPAESAEKIWQGVVNADKEARLLPVGLGARDSLRLEAGFSLYGNELDDETSPIEAGLSWTVKMKKEDFIGKKALVKQQKNGIKKRLVCFSMNESGIPRHGYPLFKGDQAVGSVTSGTFSSMLNRGIGMGYSSKEFKKNDTVYVEIRGKKHACTVVERPFYKRSVRV